MSPIQRSETNVRECLLPHVRGLRARALQLCGNEAEADDLLQDTVERALRFAHTYHPGTNLRAWMHRILKTVFISMKRRSHRERRALEVIHFDPCAWTSVEPAPEMLRVSPQVERAMRTLSPRFAEVVWLVDVGELSYKDAADQLAVPVGTVMSRLFRGRRQLAATLASAATPLQRSRAA